MERTDVGAAYLPEQGTRRWFFENWVRESVAFGNYSSNFYRDQITGKYCSTTIQLAFEAFEAALDIKGKM
jgi:hypothetical protein